MSETPSSSSSAGRKTNVGGQAVLEGVMMRSPRCVAVAVRRKSGSIVIREQPWKAAWSSRLAKVPFVRGAVTLFESMQNGYSALRFSADQLEQDLAREQAEAADAALANAEAGEAADDAAPPSVTQSEKVNAEVAAAVATADAPAAGASGAGTRLATIL